MKSLTGNGVLVATNNSLSAAAGGVQACTRDHIVALERAGFKLEFVGFDPTHDLLTRCLNRLDGRGYRRMIPDNLAHAVIEAVKRTNAPFVFFNEADFTFVALRLRREFERELKLVHLSHGLRSTDIAVREQTTRRLQNKTVFDGSAAKEIGARLQFEADYRRYLDGSICIAPLDAELERWLGVSHVRWFPRPICETRLDPLPINGRVGCVSTLNHIPNYNGLTQVFGLLAKSDAQPLHVRLVGSPEEIGKDLAARFDFVQYLGVLTDSDLRSEARSWCCFLHPIFDYARGCSTKVSVALGWGLPLVTTVFGVRGYLWDQAVLPLARTPSQVQEMIVARSRVQEFEELSRRIRRIADMQPSLEIIAEKTKEFLISL